jgi:hypothetical protein
MAIYVGDAGTGTKDIIEVLGIAGVGKTHIWGNIVHELQLSRFAVARAGYEPRRMLRALRRGFLSYGLERDRYKISRMLFSRMRQAEVMAHADDGVFVVDEGLLQLVCSSIGVRRASGDINWILQDVLSLTGYRPAAVFSFTASPEVVRHRRRLRNRTAEKSTLLSTIVREDELYRQGVRHLRSMTTSLGCEFVELDVSSDEGAENARSVIRLRLERYLRRAGEGVSGVQTGAE